MTSPAISEAPVSILEHQANLYLEPAWPLPDQYADRSRYETLWPAFYIHIDSLATVSAAIPPPGPRSATNQSPRLPCAKLQHYIRCKIIGGILLMSKY
jgi:hypothetical protein